MTISSVGYAGTVTDAEWANLAPRVGNAYYGVADFASFRAVPSSGTRNVSVEAGSAWAMGIRDVSDAPVIVNLPAVVSGTRWDMIVLRRTWATKATTVEVISGGSSKVLPPRTTDAGTVHEQPLALVRVVAGSGAIQEIVDLRVWTQNGGAVAVDDLVRSYLAHLGTVIRIGDITWTRTLNASGAAIWVSDNVQDSGWVDVPAGSTWTVLSNYGLRARRVGDLVEVRGAVTSKDSTLGSLATLPSGFRASSATPLSLVRCSGGGFSGHLQTDSSGQIWPVAGYYTGSINKGNIILIHEQFFRG